MYNILLTIQYISIGILFIESAYIFARWKTRLQGILFFSSVATLINGVGYLMEMLAQTENDYLHGLQMSYLGRTWIPFGLMLFIVYLANVRIPKWVLFVLAVFHGAVFALVLTCQYHSLYYSSMVFETEGLFPHLETKNGPVHIVYSVLLGIYIVFGLTHLFMAAHKEKNPIARKRTLLVAISIAVESVFFVIQTIKIFPVSYDYDLTMLGYSISAVIMWIAIFKYDLLDTLEVAKDFVLDDIAEGIFVYNPQGELEYVNSAGQQLLGELPACVYQDRETAAELRSCMDECIRTDEPMKVGEKIFSPQKKELTHKNTDRGIVYVVVDDTEHYRYMRELEEQKNLAENAREEAEGLSASKSQMLSVVSHEIRTPMNAVVGMTELLLRDRSQLNNKQEKYLQNIKNSGSALVMIVNDLLDQSKIEAGKMKIVEDSYELRPMVSDVKMIIENRLGSKPIHLITEIDDRVPRYLVGDSLRIRQILINLMNNAVKFTEEGYIQLTICPEEDRTSETEKTVLKQGASQPFVSSGSADRKGTDAGNLANGMRLHFSVKDSGQGIRPEDLNRLGEAFSQVDVKKNHGKEGTGLGLSISKDFIRMMGGCLQVSSVYGKGSEFYFSIPQGIGEGTPAAGYSGVSKQAWQEEEDFVCPKASVLVVDDTEINLLIMQEMLDPLQLQVTTAGSGEAALELLKTNHYDMIFMDYMMPYMDGVETTERIRTLGMVAAGEGNGALADYYHSVPIIALSGDDSEGTKEKFRRAGIDDFTEKPVDMKRIKKLMIKWMPEGLIEAK